MVDAQDGSNNDQSENTESVLLDMGLDSSANSNLSNFSLPTVSSSEDGVSDNSNFTQNNTVEQPPITDENATPPEENTTVPQEPLITDENVTTSEIPPYHKNHYREMPLPLKKIPPTTEPLITEKMSLPLNHLPAQQKMSLPLNHLPAQQKMSLPLNHLPAQQKMSLPLNHLPAQQKMSLPLNHLPAQQKMSLPLNRRTTPITIPQFQT